MTLTAHVPATAHAAARTLAERGVGVGTRIAVEGTGDVLSWLLGADLLGAATLVLEPTWTAADRAAVLADARPALIVDGSPDPAEPIARDDVFDSGHTGGDGDPYFYLPTTSGSTGTPKVGLRTRSSWIRSFEALGPVEGPVLVAGPLSSSLFLFGALHATWCGADLRLHDQWRPADAREAATVHLVPAMLAELVADAERRPGPSALRTVVCGGAHLGDALRDRFTRAFPEARLVEYYGSAELSLIAIRRDGELRPAGGVDVDVSDGVLWVRSPLAFSGYLRGGTLEPAAEWLSNGDHGQLTRSGGLVVDGRGSAVIASGGTQVPAEPVEDALRTVAGVDDALVTGTPHPRLGLLVTAVVQARQPPALAELRAAVRDALRPELRPRRWLWTTSLPRTASGKTARDVAQRQLQDGTFDGVPLTAPETAVPDTGSPGPIAGTES
ncbi:MULTISPECIES: AMP-binding protein [Prauserella salsuginis group]|uniref:AMP-binding protein n=1 Tax=Prauserella salsuginis TaxID=387889 RepID=A0ABW6FYR1_9PSEU|nr:MULTISPECIES: AMP-binding protein [Prauserella salsuginis group]MCR3720554.1 Acyl-CoA synthetase (AMP-forming)/AMP-acid ligase II [Prauserella flava]MCR3733736.1 Acyl-CoA synthetase (AMP-forming)/AMP-acid ligase II [Prauserella salsuginis]